MNMTSNKKILITGARGFLGSTLMIMLKAAGYEPVAFDGDIREREHVLQSVAEIAPAWVIHTAAKIDVAECEKDPDLARAVNVEGTRNMADATEAAGAKLIFISTASVFSGDKGDYKETDPVEPLNVYSRTKVEGEALVGKYAEGTVVRLLLLGVRPDGLPGKNFFEWVVRKAMANEDMQLFTDQFVNHISNWSTAAYIQKIMELPHQEKVLHLGSSDVVSKAALARIILEHYPQYTGSVKEISVEDVGDQVVRPKQMWLNTDRAAKLFGPMPSTHEELALIWKNM